MKLSNKMYDALGNTVKLVLPAIGTLYFTLGSVWGFPYGEQVVGSFAAIATFLGGVLAFAKKNWSSEMDGTLVVNQSDPNKDTFSLEVITPLEDVANNKTLSLKVVKEL